MKKLNVKAYKLGASWRFYDWDHFIFAERLFDYSETLNDIINYIDQKELSFTISTEIFLALFDHHEILDDIIEQEGLDSTITTEISLTLSDHYISNYHFKLNRCRESEVFYSFKTAQEVCVSQSLLSYFNKLPSVLYIRVNREKDSRVMSFLKKPYYMYRRFIMKRKS